MRNWKNWRIITNNWVYSYTHAMKGINEIYVIILKDIV